MGVLEQDIQAELQKLKSQLEQVRLTQRDTSFKFNREQQVLKRMVTSLATTCRGSSSRLNQSLEELCFALEQQKDISTLIPKLAVLERMLKQQSLAMDKQTSHLDSQLQHSGETLLRVPGLPAKIKRDLRDLLSFSAAQPLEKLSKLCVCWKFMNARSKFNVPIPIWRSMSLLNKRIENCCIDLPLIYNT
ncbi:hypothetical protein WI845_05170 [Vibrio cholerae]